MSSQNLFNQKSSESGNRDRIGVKAFSKIMSHPDVVPLLEIQYDHVGTSLVSCTTKTNRSDLWHAVQYDIYSEILFVELYSGDVKDIHSSHRRREDSSTRVVSSTDIQDDTIKNQSPAIPSCTWRCYSSCKCYLLFWICKQQKTRLV